MTPLELNDVDALRHHYTHDGGLEVVMYDSDARVLSFAIELPEGDLGVVQTEWYATFTFYDVRLLVADPHPDQLQAWIAQPHLNIDVTDTRVVQDDAHGHHVLWAGSLYGFQGHRPPQNAYVFRFASSGFTYTPDHSRPNPYL